MKVWILADVARSVPGGMRRHMELHAEGLRRLGHEASLFFSEDFRAGAAVRVPKRLPGIKTLLSLRARHARELPDVVNVHTQCAPAWILAARTGRIRSRVVVMSYAADEGAINLQRPRDLLRWARAALPARSTFPRADGIWCVNTSDLDYYRLRYGVAASKLRCIPHAVNDSFYRENGANERDPRQLLFAGTWITRKGVDVLAPALDLALHEAPELRVVLAGTLVPPEEVRRCLTPRVAERTRIVPTADDQELGRLYRTSSLLLIPSRLEGLPIVMLEAMACGCPALAAANSGMLDVIEPGQNGWLEGSFDPERWARRILELTRSPKALATASQGAMVTAEAFRIESVGRVALDWYASLRAG
ncbi:MAG TPA: glycosyltransferase family 4 protein [Polyangiaceae bacterium]|nr:glycosyltransferase family 4 protein [Polyangiaceae bacterium]